MARPGEFDQPIGDPVEPIFKGETAVLIATGPSINEEQVAIVKQAHEAGKCRTLTINNSYQIAPFTNAHLTVGDSWYQHYWPLDEVLRTMPAHKYTWYLDIAKQYNIKYIKAVVKDGISTDPRIIHINHGSGPMMVNLAYHYGIRRLLLIGHDMRFATNYDGRRQKVGSTPRHYFGEYPKQMQHWPSVKIGLSKPGVIDGLIEVYNKMGPQLKSLGMEVINCTPASSLPTFPMSDLRKELNV